MSELIYTTVPGKISGLLAKIRDVGVPSKVTVAWLKIIGFTSSNDTTLIGVLKLVGLTDQNGVPTTAWQAFRGPNGRAVLGAGIKSGYTELYSVYPDAHARSDTELEQVFSMSTKAGKQVRSKIVSTFKKLAVEADFDDYEPNATITVDSGPLHVPLVEQKPQGKAPMNKTSPSLHIDMQIHISPDSSAEQIDLIFASMAKHLYGAN